MLYFTIGFTYSCIDITYSVYMSCLLDSYDVLTLKCLLFYFFLN